MSNQYTDCKLSAITLTNISGDRKANIIDQVKHIDIYESILSPVIRCDLFVQDGIDLLNKFPILSEEYVEFSFESHTRLKRTMKLQVESVEQQTQEFSGRSKSYILKCVSPEHFKSSTKLIHRKFKQQTKDSILDILLDITEKDLEREETKGIDEVIISKLRPFQAIDFLRRRSISPYYKSSSFCFFENRDGYKFRTLEGLFESGRKKIGDKIFFYENNLQQDIRTAQYRACLGYEHVKINSSLDTLQMGGAKNRVTKYDIITGQVEKIDFGNQNFETVDERANPTSSTYFDSQYNDIAQSFLIPYDGSLPEYDLPEKVGFNQIFVSRIVQNLVRIHVNGDSSISAGDVITLKLPDFSGLSGESKQNRLQSGNYLIAKVRHMITVKANSTYTASFELIKGSNLS